MFSKNERGKACEHSSLVFWSIKWHCSCYGRDLTEGINYTSVSVRSVEIYYLITVATVTEESFVKVFAFFPLPAALLYLIRVSLPLTATHQVDCPAHSPFIQEALTAHLLYAKASCMQGPGCGDWQVCQQ